MEYSHVTDIENEQLPIAKLLDSKHFWDQQRSYNAAYRTYPLGYQRNRKIGYYSPSIQLPKLPQSNQTIARLPQLGAVY